MKKWLKILGVISLVVSVVFNFIFFGALSSAEEDIDILMAENEYYYNEISKLEATQTDTEHVSEDAKNVEEADSQTYQVNEPIILSRNNSNDNDVTVVIKEVTDNPDILPDYMHSFEEYDVDNIITVTVNYTNNNLDENIAFGPHDFQIFSSDGQPLENMSMSDGGEAVGKDRSGTSTFYFGTNGETLDEVIIDFVPIMSGQTVATIQADVVH